MFRSRILWRLLVSHVLVALAVLTACGVILFGAGSESLGYVFLVAGLAGLGAAALAALWSACRLCGPMARLTEAIRALGQSPTNHPLPVQSQDELGVLTAAFNDMGQSIAEAIARMHQELEQLRAVFRSMAEGVVVIDGEQRILFLNEAGSRMLNIDLEGSSGKRLWEVVRHRQLLEAVEQVFQEGIHRCELDWTGAEPKVFSLHGTRLPGEPLQGAVLVLHDITHVRRLERVRQDFVANVSHELKTPLAAIKATVETLLDGAIDDPQHNVRFLERVHENANRLHFLVQDLLTLSRIESGEERLEAVPLAVAGVIESCVSRQIDRAKAKQLTLRQEPPQEPILANADEEALAQILDNLVDNAIKYTPSGGTITLRWYAQDGWAVIEVADTGVGIPEKDLGRIFERFYRVDKARSRELGGTGLGLSIVKHLVQALGGSVHAASQLGVGSTFTVRLPLAEASSLVVAI
ncbi:MAG: ATP-binding protein [Gemmatales bacterium]|nr:ATP-binding protein [Gemmatales bacterium]MDW8387329.1 ATP-binding protein [Gemmatales bacterium]